LGEAPHKGETVNPADLSEEGVDLDLDRRKAILAAEQGLGQNHWEVLGLPWNAPVERVKAAYLEAAKVYHPDRYAGRKLGSYRGRLERIFRRMTEARDALADEARRAAYAKATAPATEFARMEARRLEDERRSAERRARLARQNPLVARASRVGELAARGKEAFGAGDFARAANDLQVAQSLDPGNAELAALAAEAKRRASTRKSADHYDKALAAETLGTPGLALAEYRAALEADPRHVRAAAAGARVATAQGDLATARELAQAAVRAAPGMGMAHEALGLVLEAQGDKKEARRAFEKALELDPKLDTAKERLRKLRWGILG
jgi:curved DNA-binding protein CbpA